MKKEIHLHTIIVGLLLAQAPLNSRAAVVNVIGTYANWPSSWTSLGLNDGADSGVAGSLDIVGNTSYPAVQYAQDSSCVYFRMQLNSASAPTDSSYFIYIDKAGTGSANVPDYAFAWDRQSNDSTKHGLEMMTYSTGSGTWGNIKMNDLDGGSATKGSVDINGPTGAQRTTDGYLRVDYGVTGASGAGQNTYIEMAVSWSYLQSYTGLGPGQTWSIAAGVVANANDHNSIGSNGDVAGGLDLIPSQNYNYATSLSDGWSSPIVTVPEVSATPVVMGGLTCLLALFRSRRKVAACLLRSRR